MKLKHFNFTGSNSKHTKNYLEMIEAEDLRVFVANFFEPSILQFISPKTARELVAAINHDVQNGVFKLVTSNATFKTVVNSHNTMTPKQINSKTHKLFLKAISEGFGKSAVKTLKERKNLNIFNLTEIHVLHQEVFDNFGEGFVNRILNNDLTPQSLIIIKNILSNKEEMNNFKYYYDFYTKNIGEKQADFERMIRSYDNYKRLISNIKSSKHKLTHKQKETLTDILTDPNNRYHVATVTDIDNFYQTKNELYEIEKRKAKSFYGKNDDYFMSASISILANSIFKNYFGVESSEHFGNFSIIDKNPYSICKYFDLDEIIQGNLPSSFTTEEFEMLVDMKRIVDIAYSSDKQFAFENLLQMCEKYEQKGNDVSTIAFKMFEKIPSTFEKEIVSSLSTVEQIKKRVDSKEQGISIEKSPLTNTGAKIDLPVYIFDGADFAFLSTTNYTEGLSGNQIVGDFAESWFEYENGTTHICCSYSNQDKLSNLEFNKVFQNDEQVTYFFDDLEILTMGPRDIFTNPEPRVSNLSSDESTKFMSSSKIAEESYPNAYNEVDASRYHYNGNSISFAGKIIPSGILCCDKVTDAQLNIAKNFTNYCVEHGLKPAGWKMPIVVVKKQRYLELQKQKKQKLLSKNSEYFVHEEKEKVETVEEEKKEKKNRRSQKKANNKIGGC